MPTPLHHSPAAVENWLRRIYERAPGHLSVVYQDATGTFRGAGGTVPDANAALERVARLDADGAQGIYLRTTTLSRSLEPHERGGSEDSMTLPGLWADVDFGTVGHKNGRRSLPLPPDEQAARRIVTSSGLPDPSLWVHSGGGLYPWWLFDEPLHLTDDVRAKASAISTMWQCALARSGELLGYDYGAGVGDLARVLRVPGTVNRKAGQARECRVIQDDGPAYTLSEFEDALQSLESSQVPAAARFELAQVRSVTRSGPNTTPRPFDIVNEHATFDDILAGAGFNRHEGNHPPIVDQCWTRPGDPDNPCSAHTLKANPHVLVVFSELAGLPTGAGRRLTRSRVFAHLHHAGDERAASRDLHAAITNRPATTAAAALPLPREMPHLMTPNIARLPYEPTAESPALFAVPESDTDVPASTGQSEHDHFWTARPELEHLRAFARARRAAPWAVLGCALTRVVAQVEPDVVLPPIIGGEASLNLFLGLVGPSGGGKGAAESAASDAIRFDSDDPPAVAGVGSGEGIAHTYLRYVVGKKGAAGSVEQHTTRALFRAPEVDTLAALKGRQGSTLLPKLRDAWIGDALGFAYADVTRRLDLQAHQYRLCLVVGIQPARASVLVDDADGGTPQRFLWLPTMDANVPAQAPPEPAPIDWQTPALNLAAVSASGRYRFLVCDAARAAIDQAAVARHQGRVTALDGHALLCRLKTAAALGLLNGRYEVTDDDWEMAGIVMQVSDTTRAGVLRSLGERSAATTIARGRAEGLRAVAVEETKNEHGEQRVGRLIMRKLSDDWTSRNDLRKALPSRDRGHFDSAMERLITTGLVESEYVEHNGARGNHCRKVPSP